MNRYRVNAYRNRRRILANAIADAESEIAQSEQSECIDPSINDNFNSDHTIRELIRAWVNCHGVTTRAVNDLLKILVSAGI